MSLLRPGGVAWLLAHEVPLADGAQATDAVALAEQVRDALRRHAATRSCSMRTGEVRQQSA